MTRSQIAKQLASMQRQIDELKTQVRKGAPKNPWRAVAGSFENDPLFKKAMQLGAAYRKSLRPGARRSQRRK